MTSPSQYEHRITTEYDEQFKAVKDLKWDPWVGVDYHKYRILIMGKSAYYTDDTNLEWKKACDDRRDPSRSLVAQNYDDPPFWNTFNIFVEGAEKDHDGATSASFWNSVAFNNHCQQIVKNSDDPCGDMAQANRAFDETLAILKPNLCLVWGVEVVDGMNIENAVWGDEEINGAYPRIAHGDGNRPPIIGIKHPSWGVTPADWREFLLNHSISKEIVAAFIDYLKTHPTK